MPTADAGPSDLIAAPPHLTAETRLAFRRAALAAVAHAEARGLQTVVIDLRATPVVDATGLGLLVFVQRRAAESGLRTRLLGATPALRQLIAITQLDALFAFDD
jgi:anti-anti-sigma factor